MTATLADVNTTLGITNIALSSVVSEQKETNKGISAFVDFIKDKDADDARRALEDSRESKPILKSIGGGASAIGGGLVSAGKSTFGFGKGLLSKLALPAGFLGGFLTSLLSSKLLKGGILGLGVYFGDEIAEYLLGDDAKDEVKKAFGNVIKGASIGGFLFGKKGFLIGGALTALLQNKKVDKELGRLTTNINEFAKKIGFKDGLLGVIQSIGNAVGTGLQGLNDLADGKVDFKSVSSTLGLLSGAAFLVSPRGSGKLAVAAGLALARSPAGRVLMALAGIGYATGLFDSGDSKAGTGGAGDAFANNIKNKSADGKKVLGGDVGGLSKFFTLDNIIGATTAAYLGKSLYDLGKGGISLFKKFGKFGKATDAATDAVSIMQKANKGPGYLARAFGLLKTGAKGAFGLMTSASGVAIMVPLAAVGITEALFGDQLRKENLENTSKQNANKLKGTMTKKGINAGINITGGGGPEMMDGKLGLGKLYADSPIFAKVGGGSGSTLADYFKNLPPGAPGPTGNSGNVISSNTVNSGNTYNSTGFAINAAGAKDPRNAFGQIAANASGLF
jgi:hypothetical protein